MSTTLLNSVTAGATAGLSNGFRVDIGGQGAVGISCQVTTGGADLASFGDKPLILYVQSSNFTDGPQTPAGIKDDLGGSGMIAIPLEIDTASGGIKYTEDQFVASGPVMYGYLDAREALSADVTILVQALAL